MHVYMYEWEEPFESFFSASVGLDAIIDSLLTRLPMALATIKLTCFKRTAGELD